MVGTSRNRPLLLDGGTGTELMRQGMPRGVCTEQWILRHPDVLVRVQRDYAAAGSGVLLTPTFGASRARLRPFGLEDRTAEYNARLAALTCRAAGPEVRVAGDLGPLCLTGPVSSAELEDIYREQICALERSGAECFLAETAVSLREAEAAVRAARRESDRPVWVSFACGGRGVLPDGTEIQRAFQRVQSLGADAVGLNCGSDPEYLAGQLIRLAPLADVPLIFKPSLPADRRSDPERWMAAVPALLGAGVLMFGGCCGTGPAQIARLAAALKAAVRLPGGHPERS